MRQSTGRHLFVREEKCHIKNHWEQWNQLDYPSYDEWSNKYIICNYDSIKTFEKSHFLWERQDPEANIISLLLNDNNTFFFLNSENYLKAGWSPTWVTLRDPHGRLQRFGMRTWLIWPVATASKQNKIKRLIIAVISACGYTSLASRAPHWIPSNRDDLGCVLMGDMLGAENKLTASLKIRLRFEPNDTLSLQCRNIPSHCPIFQ